MAISGSDSTQRVIKTLIIGLGSTGTRICNAVAERVRWELNDVRRAPWMQFLCVETNANEESLFHESGDFCSLRINGADYSQILESPKAYDEKILLSQWIDSETLRKLPNKDVSEGAGNIRMVGRLAFLFEENYNQLKIAIHNRVGRLRTLSSVEAAEIRGMLADGSNPAVEFSADGEVRIIVIGTLCGGTCSGLVADFGYFLKEICRIEEKSIALLTIPRHDLVTSLEPAANKYKSNAYHSLIELNHYHLAGRDDENQIRFPDGVLPDVNTFPYDLTFLSMPRTVGTNGEESLNRALADRIFINVFVPQADPFADAINAPVMDREHRAHVFCSFGLSSIEFPAYQVMEACEKRLLAYALREWLNRSLSLETEQAVLKSIGLTWDGVVVLLCEQPGKESVQSLLQKKQREVCNAARVSFNRAMNSLDELRGAFASGVTERGTGMYHGMVGDRLAANRSHAAEQVMERVRGYIDTHLLDYREGPAPILQILNKAQERIQQLLAVQLTNEVAPTESVDAVMRQLRRYHTSPLLAFFWMRKRAINREIPRLEEALRSEVNERINRAVTSTLQNRSVNGTTDNGMLKRVSILLEPIQKRLNNLRTTLTALIVRINQRADELATKEPVINGLNVFEPETTIAGTVREEFQRCLLEASNDPTETWEHMREMQAAQVIRSWETLPDSVCPVNRTRQDDWLLQQVNPHAKSELIPANDMLILEMTARQPFLHLTEVDVLERWQNMSNPVQEIRKIADDAKPFLEINKAQAEHGGRPPIQIRSIVLTPSSPLQDEFLRIANQSQPRTVNQKNALSPDRFRAVLLEEWFRFPLSGVTSVLGKEGLHATRCSDFPTFHTRMDVQWTGLSDKQIAALRRSEELLTCGVLLGVLKPAGKALVMHWQEGGFGDEGSRRLPLSLRGAIQSLANEDRDINGRSLNKAMQLIEQRIEQERKKMADDIAYIQRLQDELKQGTGSVIQGWNIETAARYLDSYCANHDEKLYIAYTSVFPPDPALIDSLRRDAKEIRPRGGIFEEAGLYCTECGGLVGKDEQDASRNGWRCFVNPEHYFGRGSELVNRRIE